jgi:hypothetical protein
LLADPAFSDVRARGALLVQREATCCKAGDYGEVASDWNYAQRKFALKALSIARARRAGNLFDVKALSCPRSR